jgi:predicted membrane protein
MLLVVGWMPRRIAMARLGQFAAGVGAVIGPLALHGWLTGWDDWWYAIVGYRKDQRSALVGAVWDRLDQTWRDALPILLPALAVAIACAIGLVRQRRLLAPSPMVGALLMWPLCALLTFALGGQFYHHYWVLLTFPVAALAGLFIGALRSARLRVAAVVVALAPAAWSFAGLVTLGDDEIYPEVNGHELAGKAERVGDWFDDHAAHGDTFYVLCASAATYAHADADPPYRYLWFDNVHNVPGAVESLEAMFAGAQRPTYVAVFQSGASCGSPRIDDLLAVHYRRAAVVDGVVVLRAGG